VAVSITVAVAVSIAVAVAVSITVAVSIAVAVTSGFDFDSRVRGRVRSGACAVYNASFRCSSRSAACTGGSAIAVGIRGSTRRGIGTGCNVTFSIDRR
ncbi:MAG TPA: hypothetical protein VMT98_20085, partial [Verrucomicrobiae bacterium]|nr:hypothetical protein [Verrucomicrobiae bacterium]